MSSAKYGLYLIGRIVESEKVLKKKTFMYGYALALVKMPESVYGYNGQMFHKPKTIYDKNLKINVKYFEKYAKYPMDKDFQIIFVSRELGYKLALVHMIRNAGVVKHTGSLDFNKLPDEEWITFGLSEVKEKMFKSVTPELKQLLDMCNNTGIKITDNDSKDSGITLNALKIIGKYNGTPIHFNSQYKVIGLVFNKYNILIGARAVRSLDKMEVIISLEELKQRKPKAEGDPFNNFARVEIKNSNDKMNSIYDSLVCVKYSVLSGFRLRKLILCPDMVTPGVAELFFPGKNIYNYDDGSVQHKEKIALRKNVINSARKIEYDLASGKDIVNSSTYEGRAIVYDLSDAKIIAKIPYDVSNRLYYIVRVSRLGNRNVHEKDSLIVSGASLNRWFRMHKIDKTELDKMLPSIDVYRHCVGYRTVDWADNQLAVTPTNSTKNLSMVCETLINREQYSKLLEV